MNIYNKTLGSMVLLYFYGQRFNETLNCWEWQNGIYPFEVGRGYAIKFNPSLLADSKRLITFGSTVPGLNTNTISYQVTYTAGLGDGWNLVCNPYPSSIDMNAESGWYNTNIEPTIYVYDGQNSRYMTYNSYDQTFTNGGMRYVPPMQGVFIHCIAAGQWSMDNRVRIAYNQKFFKSGDLKTVDSDQLNLIVSGNNYSDETVIGFNAEATKGFDGNYDAYKLLSPEKIVPQINTKTLDDKPVRTAVNCLPTPLMQESSVPLEFTVGVAGAYTISAANFNTIDPSVAITLEDLKTKKLTDLRTSVYTFSSDSVTNDSRFMVHFGPLPTSINEKNILNNINIYTDHNSIVIQNNSSSMENGTIIIYDVLGKEIISRNLESNSVTRIDMNNDAQAIYFVKVTTNNQTVTKKVCVNK